MYMYEIDIDNLLLNLFTNYIATQYNIIIIKNTKN